MNPRILQICPHDTPPFDNVCARFIEAADLLDATVTTVYLGAAAAEPHNFADYLHAADLSNTTRLRGQLDAYAQQRWDLVICHRYRAYWSVARTRLARNPCVVLAHEFGFFERWQRRLKRRLFAPGFQFAGVSQPVADELAAHVGHALVLPNVVNIERSQAALLSRAQARTHLGLSEQDFVVGVVGRLHYKKRPQLAADAFAEFKAEVPHARLVFVGEGASAELAAHQDVHITGFLPQAAQYMRAFDVLLHTARVESFGLVVLEALLAGVPVACAPLVGPGYVMGPLGCYADADSPAGFSRALLQASQLDREAFAAQAETRVRQYFSVTALAEALGPLLQTQAA